MEFLPSATVNNFRHFCREPFYNVRIKLYKSECIIISFMILMCSVKCGVWCFLVRMTEEISSSDWGLQNFDFPIDVWCSYSAIVCDGDMTSYLHRKSIYLQRTISIIYRKNCNLLLLHSHYLLTVMNNT